MRSYVKAKDVHRHMRQHLAPWFSERQWRKRPGYACAFVKDDLVLWAQPSQWGESWSGSSMTLNLAQSATGQLAAGDRILWHLDEASRQTGLAIEERVVSRIPQPPPDHYVHEFMTTPGQEGENWRQSFARAFQSNPIVWQGDHDIWLRYFAEDDLEEWAAFLLPRLDSLLSKARLPAGSV